MPYLNIISKIKTIFQPLNNQVNLLLRLFFIFAIILVTWQFFKPVANEEEIQMAPVATETDLNIKSAIELEQSLPIRLRIPKITIDVAFSEPLGLLSNGEAMTPSSYEQVGWYRYGPTPGELGPAVVLGHVDSYEGPAVFFYLGQLVAGDDVFVDREDGTTAHFKVTSLERYRQSDFPTQAVYGDLDYAGLRLITCTGIYEHGKQRYTHNLVVYAKLVSD